MTTMTLDDVRPAATAPEEADELLRTELVATWCAETRPTATWSAQARPTAALQRRLIAGMVG